MNTLTDLKSIDLSQYTEFFNDLERRSSGYNIYIGGGMIRDLFFNIHHGKKFKPLKPKDVDLFFVPIDESSNRDLPVIPKTYINYETDSGDIPDMEERGVEKVRGIFVKSLPVCDVQFICYKNNMSAQDLASDMDCNINQVMMNISTGEFSFTEDFESGHKQMNIEMLHSFKPIRMAKRIYRMKQKFKGYEIIGDWDLSGVVERITDHPGSFCED